jgi:hypothetical protein
MILQSALSNMYNTYYCFKGRSNPVYERIYFNARANSCDSFLGTQKSLRVYAGRDSVTYAAKRQAQVLVLLHLQDFSWAYEGKRK